MSLRAEKKQAQRQQILSVCRELFLSRGFDATTVVNITDGAGISRQTFFNYFRSKDEALLALGMSWLQQQANIPVLDSTRAKQGNFLAGIRKAILAQMRAIESDADFMQLVFTRSGVIFPTADDNRNARLDYTKPLFDRLAAIIALAQEQGEVRKDITALQVAEMYVSQMLMTARLWLGNYFEERRSLVTHASKALDVLEAGLRTHINDATQRK